MLSLPARRLALAAVAVASLISSPPARAQELSGTVSLATDYVVRGFSRSAGRPALQAGLTYRHRSGFTAGLWGSTVDFSFDDELSETRRMELNGFAGYSASLTDNWAISALLLDYQYPGVDGIADTSYPEAQVSASFRDLLLVAVAYTSDLFAVGAAGFFLEASGAYPLAGGFSLVAGLGRAELDTRIETSYTYGHLGSAWTHRRFALDLSYFLSDSRPIPRWGEVADDRWVLSLSIDLP